MLVLSLTKSQTSCSKAFKFNETVTPKSSFLNAFEVNDCTCDMQLQFIKNNQRKKENSDYNINDDDFTWSPCLTFSLIYLKASTEYHLNLYVLAHFDTAGM